MVCVLGASNLCLMPQNPTPKPTIQFIEFTTCHDWFLETTIETKRMKYHPLIDIPTQQGWKVNPLITITAGIRGALFEHTNNPTYHLDKLYIIELL